MSDGLSREDLAALCPKTKRYEVQDGGAPGLVLRVSPDGVKVWAYRYRMHGRPCRFTIGPYPAWTGDMARRKARALRVQTDNGEDPGLIKARARDISTVAELLDEVDKEHFGKLKDSTVRTYRGLIKHHIKPRLGKIRVDQVSMADISRFHRALYGRVGNQALAVLSKALNLAESWGLRELGTNPCQHQARNREAKRQRYLTEQELMAVGEILRAGVATWEERGKPVRIPLNALCVGALRVLMLTGMRKAEVLGLTWDRVDEKHGRIILDVHKTDVHGSKAVFLSPNLRAVFAAMKGLKRLGNSHVFPGAGKSGNMGSTIDHAWQCVRRAAGCPDVRIHDLRHTYASVAAGLGMSLPQIGALLGHSAPATTQRYSHLAPTTLQESVERIGAVIGEAIG